MNNPRITVLVSDLGNVVLPLEPEIATRALAAASDRPEEIQQAVACAAAESGIGRGLASPQAFYERLAAAVGLRMGFAEFCRTWSDIFFEDHEAVDLVRQARVRWRYLLSNTDPIHWEWIRQRHATVLAPFDLLFPSHECGMEKPDPEIFRLVMRASGEPPEAHLFIDDLPENVAAARALGMDGVIHQSAGGLREALCRRGLL